MRNRCALPPGGAPISGLALHTAWDVDADGSYDVRRGGRAEPGHAVAVLTLLGQGRLSTTGGEIVALPGSLVLCDLRRLQRYRSEHGRWRFWWFQFSAAGGPLPCERCLAVRPSRSRAQACRHIFEDLAAASRPRQRMAAARFDLLLAECLEQAPADAARAPVHPGVERALAALHADPARRWSVAGLARLAGLGERRFRDLFRAVVGRAPKRYHDELRLRLAEQLLLVEGCSVLQTAERLGYACPFHFSRVFHAHFGLPPSQVGSG